MKSFKQVIGIDVAQDTLAISIYDGSLHEIREIDYTVSNIKKHLVSKFSTLREKIIFVMEATGVYHSKLAYMLYEQGYKVAVINPFIIKKYAEMRLMRVKTDSVDASLIASYGYDYQNEIEFYVPQEDTRIAIDNTIKAIDDLIGQKTMTTNQLHALTKQAYCIKHIMDSYRRHIRFLDKEIKKLEVLLEKLLQEAFSKEYALLKTIPGVGLKTSAMIIAVFDAFKTFESAKHACSFAGIAPSPYQSGTSVRKRGTISKRGNALARKILYMGTLSATKHNPLVKQKYNRLVELGKPKKVALLAAANKLLRIAFGVLKSGTPFNTDLVQERM